MSAGIDKSLYIIWDTLSYEYKQYWLKESFYNIFGRMYYENSGYEDNIIEQLNKLTSEYDIQYKKTNLEGKSSDSYMNDLYKTINQILLSLAFVFSIGMCFGVSNLWIMYRESELQIRKAYGYSYVDIFILVSKDIFYLMIPSMIIAICIQAVSDFLLDKCVLFGQVGQVKFITIIIGIICIIILNAYYLTRKICRGRVKVEE